jgi:hypothetical protein
MLLGFEEGPFLTKLIREKLRQVKNGIGIGIAKSDPGFKEIAKALMEGDLLKKLGGDAFF